METPDCYNALLLPKASFDYFLTA